jgi:ribosomal protein L16 Arg81 hydroxylase
MRAIGLQEILSPLDCGEFLSNYLGQKFFHQRGEPSRFSDLLTWPELNSLLERHKFTSEISLWKDGEQLAPERYSSPTGLMAPELTGLLRDGATLVLNSIDRIHEPIALLSQNLGKALQCRVAVNLYVGWRVSRGFDLHTDDHDVFILQVRGRKRWQIHGQMEERFPLRSGPATANFKPRGGPIWEETLQAGDLLYIPRGCWHVATPCDEPTVHLTVGMYAATAMDLERWILGRLNKTECMRSDLPRFTDAESEARYLASIRDVFHEAFSDPDLLRKFWSDINMQLGPRPYFGLPWSATPAILPPTDDYEILVTAPRSIRPERTGGSDVRVPFNGKFYAFPDATEPLFAWLDECEHPRMAEFYSRWEEEFEREELAAFLTDLVRYGMIALRAPSAVSAEVTKLQHHHA